MTATALSVQTGQQVLLLVRRDRHGKVGEVVLYSEECLGCSRRRELVCILAETHCREHRPCQLDRAGDVRFGAEVDKVVGVHEGVTSVGVKEVDDCVGQATANVTGDGETEREDSVCDEGSVRVVVSQAVPAALSNREGSVCRRQVLLGSDQRGTNSTEDRYDGLELGVRCVAERAQRYRLGHRVRRVVTEGGVTGEPPLVTVLGYASFRKLTQVAVEAGRPR